MEVEFRMTTCFNSKLQRRRNSHNLKLNLSLPTNTILASKNFIQYQPNSPTTNIFYTYEEINKTLKVEMNESKKVTATTLVKKTSPKNKRSISSKKFQGLKLNLTNISNTKCNQNVRNVSDIGPKTGIPKLNVLSLNLTNVNNQVNNMNNNLNSGLKNDTVFMQRNLNKKIRCGSNLNCLGNRNDSSITKLTNDIHVGSVKNLNNIEYFQQHNITNIISIFSKRGYNDESYKQFINNNKIPENNDEITIQTVQNNINNTKCKINNLNKKIDLINNHLKINLHDTIDSSIYDYFEKSNNFINDRKNIGATYIHCQLGISRSVALCLAYLLKERIVMNVDEGMKFIKKKRPIADPNFGFLSQLEDYHNFLLSEETKCDNGIDMTTEKAIKTFEDHNDGDDNNMLSNNSSGKYPSICLSKLKSQTSQSSNISQISSIISSQNSQITSIISDMDDNQQTEDMKMDKVESFQNRPTKTNNLEHKLERVSINQNSSDLQFRNDDQRYQNH